MKTFKQLLNELSKETLGSYAVELDEKILNDTTYKWWIFQGSYRRLAYRSKMPHALHKGDKFGMRLAHSNPDKIRLVVDKPGYGITKVFSISKEEAHALADQSEHTEPPWGMRESTEMDEGRRALPPGWAGRKWRPNIKKPNAQTSKEVISKYNTIRDREEEEKIKKAKDVKEQSEDQGRYKIVRSYRDHDRKTVIKRNLSLAQAQAHCKDRETSSSTCTNRAGKARTKRMGPWFDGYEHD